MKLNETSITSILFFKSIFFSFKINLMTKE